MQTRIKSHGLISSKAEETYGEGTVVLRIGNGGAGATGLISALAHDYLSTTSRQVSITWVCNHSRNTQLALLHDYIDLALTYERDQEQISIDEGWATSAGCVFHDHFCLAGPISDPANVKSCTSLSDALKRIVSTKSLFHSRADCSATMIKERSLWKSVNLRPWDRDDDEPWYGQNLHTPAEAIQAAARDGAYLLIDRSTLLRQTALRKVESVTVFFEPENQESVLMNSCYALKTSATPNQKQEVDDFLEFLVSRRGQEIVTSFGKDEVGIPLFADVASGFCRASLVGGRPVSGRWERSEASGLC